MSQKLQSARGTRDLLPETSELFRFIEQKAYEKSVHYGYGEIRTPIFEFSDVFHRTLGESSDVVNKETYDFTDRGGESLTLRPEGTAGVARAFISEGLSQNLPLKFFYSGPMFRYERPQKGRYRQFFQLGVECLGYDTPLADIESIALAWDFLNELQLAKNCTLEINTLGDLESRQNYRNQLVKYFSNFTSTLSEDSQKRLEKNPLRILDSKDPKDREIISGAPSFEDSLNDLSKDFFKTVCTGLDQLGIEYKINNRLVRGLDYYSHTVFEFTTTQLGAQGTVLAGGRYDGLIETMGGPKTPGVGWAAGVDRLADLINPEIRPQNDPKIAIIAADESGEIEALKVSHELRKKNLKVENILAGKMNKKMQKANKLEAKYALIIGQTEIQNQEVTLKNLTTGEQKTLKRNSLKKEDFP